LVKNNKTLLKVKWVKNLGSNLPIMVLEFEENKRIFGQETLERV